MNGTEVKLLMTFMTQLWKKSKSIRNRSKRRYNRIRNKSCYGLNN